MKFEKLNQETEHGNIGPFVEISPSHKDGIFIPSLEVPARMKIGRLAHILGVPNDKALALENGNINLADSGIIMEDEEQPGKYNLQKDLGMALILGDKRIACFSTIYEFDPHKPQE